MDRAAVTDSGTGRWHDSTLKIQGLPGEARALLADRLVESLTPAEDGYVRQRWVE